MKQFHNPTQHFEYHRFSHGKIMLIHNSTNLLQKYMLKKFDIFDNYILLYPGFDMCLSHYQCHRPTP